MATRMSGRIARADRTPWAPPADPAAEARQEITHHRRFALREVTLGGLPVGGATVDAWQDRGGAERWSVRLLIPLAHAPSTGMLAGTAANGQRLCGVVRLGETTAGPRRGREVLAELHGDGPLAVEIRSSSKM